MQITSFKDMYIGSAAALAGQLDLRDDQGLRYESLEDGKEPGSATTVKRHLG